MNQLPDFNEQEFQSPEQRWAQLLWAEYRVLADEFLQQGKNPDSYYELKILTRQRVHYIISVLLAILGGLITAAAFNKIVAGVLPEGFRNGLGLFGVVAIAALLVACTVQALAQGLVAVNLWQKLQGMVLAAQDLSPERVKLRREAQLPLMGDLSRYKNGGLLVFLFGIGLLGAGADALAIFNLVSLYLTSDAPLLKVVATLLASLITFFIIGGKAVYDAYGYYIPTQLYTYGKMYEAMAESQLIIIEELRPARLTEERLQILQEVARLREELAISQESNTQNNKDIEQLHCSYRQEMESLQAENHQHLDRMKQAMTAVIGAHAPFAELVHQLHEVRGLLPKNEVRNHSQGE